MKTIPIEAIEISSNRQRKLFSPDAQQEFAEKIQTRGLLHAIVLRYDATHDTLELVAGERRLRAVSSLAGLGLPITHDDEPVPLGSIPYTLLSDLDALSAEEAELEENICRVDLTWQERAAAVARLDNLRQRQAEAEGKAPPTIPELTEETKGTFTPNLARTTRQELIVARHLDNPEVVAAPTVAEAFKVLQRQETQQRARVLGEVVGRTFSADLHRCYLADSLDWLKEAEAGSVDVILTDPPYGMGADEFGDSAGVGGIIGEHGYTDDADYYNKILSVCLTELIRVAKAQAHLYWFCDIDNFIKSRDAFHDEGWSVFRTPLIWYKKHGSRAPWPKEGPQRKWECILYAVKGKMPVTRMAGDVLECGPDTQLNHSAQKPVILFQNLLSRSVQPGMTVLDPFCGTGPIFPAAHALQCKAIGIELDLASYGKAVKRIQELL
jgi:DNA modification methylase